MIHLNPKAPESPFIFHRDLLSCFVEIDPNITDIVIKYFLAHASQWFFWKNVALSVHAKVAPYTAEAVKSSSLCLKKQMYDHFFKTKKVI